MKTDLPLTDFMLASQFTPIRPGPYECEMLFPDDTNRTASDRHFRWFHEKHGWSKPLDYDPDLEDEIKEPCIELFFPGLHGFDNFQFRGLAVDPNPVDAQFEQQFEVLAKDAESTHMYGTRDDEL